MAFPIFKRRFGAVMAACAVGLTAGGGAIYHNMVTAPPSVPGTANIFVSSAGSPNCSRSGTLIDYATALSATPTSHVCYDPTTPSNSFNKAYQATNAGSDLVLVACGNYTEQKFTAAPKTGMTIFRSATTKCANVEPVPKAAGSITGGGVDGTNISVTLDFTSADWITIDSFVLNGYQTQCPLATQNAGALTNPQGNVSNATCHNEYGVITESSVLGSQSTDIQILNNDIDVGKLNGGSRLIHLHLAQRWKIDGNIEGGTCCGADVPGSPVGFSIGRPNSLVALVNGPQTVSVGGSLNVICPRSSGSLSSCMGAFAPSNTGGSLYIGGILYTFTSRSGSSTNGTLNGLSPGGTFLNQTEPLVNGAQTISPGGTLSTICQPAPATQSCMADYPATGSFNVLIGSPAVSTKFNYTGLTSGSGGGTFTGVSPAVGSATVTFPANNSITNSNGNVVEDDCYVQACDITYTHNLLQYVDFINGTTYWPTSLFGSPPEQNCTNNVTCHYDGIQIFGAIRVNLSFNRFYGDACTMIEIQPAGVSLNSDYTIVGNTSTIIANGCNGFVSIDCHGSVKDGPSCSGHYDVGFNEGTPIMNIGAGWLGSAPGTSIDIYANYGNLFMTNSTGNNAGCSGGNPTNVTIRYQLNVWRNASNTTLGPCGTGDTVGTTPTWVNNSAAPATGLNMQKTGIHGAADNSVTCSALTIGGGCPAPGTLDAFGNPWPTTTANGGADQGPRP